MKTEKLIQEELERFLSIGKYITEQEEGAEEMPIEDEPAIEPEGEMGELPGLEDESGEEGVENTTEEPELADEPVTDEEPIEDEEDVEEVEVTDLVNGQKDLENKFKETESKIEQSTEKIQSVFTKLEDLENKMGDLDKLFNAVNDLGNKVEQSKPKTPEEKLELRSLDSYPFNQKLTDFFSDKETEMEVTGKNEYVLTSDDIQNMSQDDIRDTFKVNNED
jgi:hypothetical protein